MGGYNLDYLARLGSLSCFFFLYYLFIYIYIFKTIEFWSGHPNPNPLLVGLRLLLEPNGIRAGQKSLDLKIME